MEPDGSKLSTVAAGLHAAPSKARAESVRIRFGYFRDTPPTIRKKGPALSALLIMGVWNAAADRTHNLRGAKTALIGGALGAVTLSIGILWFGPLDPFSA